MGLPVLYPHIDSLMSASRQHLAKLGTPVSCEGPGCSGCCRGALEVFTFEIRHLLAAIPPEALQRIRDQRDELLDEVSRITAWCPMLDPDTKHCTIYESRPLHCRIYQVVSPRWKCFAEKYGIQDVIQVVPGKQIEHLLRTHGPTNLTRHRLGPLLVAHAEKENL